VGIYWNVDLYGPHGAGFELDRLAKGPMGETTTAMEGALMAGYAASEARAHVITGKLKASGHPSSEFDGATWDGTISFAADPGIFELARGDRPTANHPEGRHYFLDPGGPEFERGVRQAVWDWVTDGYGGPAPSGGLGPYSGGDDL
jgi:hypothetical protein